MHHATNAYARTAQAALSPREAEAAVLIKAATRLQAAQNGWTGGRGDAAFGEALTFNRRVWTLLATAATEADSPLPAEVKHSMGRLGAFVFTQTLAALAEPAPEKLSPLISINREIAAGLRGQA